MPFYEDEKQDKLRMDIIGALPFSGETAVALVERNIRLAQGAKNLLTDFLAKQGLPNTQTKTAPPASLAKAYCIQAYLKAWRNRVNPHWALLEGDIAPAAAASASTEPPPSGGAASASGTAGASPMTEKWVQDLFRTIDTTVSKLVTAKLDNTTLKIDPAARDKIRQLAQTAGRDAAQAFAEENAKPRDLKLTLATAAGAAASQNLGLQHMFFDKLLRAALARNAGGHHLNIWLTGPTGSGKTTAAKNVAQALGLAFEAEGSLDADYKLMGFFNAQGDYVETAFYRRYTQGGIILLDEIDNYGASALLAMNAALANDFCQFPCGLRQRHTDCIIIAAANTWGLGATNDYVGRNKLDAASLDRFHPKIDWPVDERLELAIADRQAPAFGVLWHNVITAARDKVRQQGLKVIISPRSTFSGIALLNSGFAPQEVFDMTFGAGLSADQKKMVFDHLTLPLAKLAQALARAQEQAAQAAPQAPESGDGELAASPSAPPFDLQPVEGWEHFDATIQNKQNPIIKESLTFGEILKNLEGHAFRAQLKIPTDKQP